jgi:hypothetical protein
MLSNNRGEIIAQGDQSQLVAEWMGLTAIIVSKCGVDDDSLAKAFALGVTMGKHPHTSKRELEEILYSLDGEDY